MGRANKAKDDAEKGSNATAETTFSVEMEQDNLSQSISVASCPVQGERSICSAASSKAQSQIVSSRDRKRWRSKNTTDGILTVKVHDVSAEAAALEKARRRHRKTNFPDGVKFGTVEIREHPITVGDNPGGFRGPPLSIEWKAQNRIKMSLEEYEKDRPPRRSGSQMNIPFTVREDMLREAGFSRGELREAQRDVNIARRHRRRTIEVMKLAPIHEISERVVRGSLNMTINRGKKRREREYIKKAWAVHIALDEVEGRSRHSAMSGSLPSQEDFDDFSDDDNKEYAADESGISHGIDGSGQSHAV